MQQKYRWRYFSCVHMHAASSVQDPPGKLPKKHPFYRHSHCQLKILRVARV